MAYSVVEPWDERRGDLNAATICKTMWSLWAGKNAQPKTEADFMPDFEPDVDLSMTPKQLRKHFNKPIARDLKK